MGTLREATGVLFKLSFQRNADLLAEPVCMADQLEQMCVSKCVCMCMYVSRVTTKIQEVHGSLQKPSLSDLLVSNVAVKEERTVSPSCMDYVSREHGFA